MIVRRWVRAAAAALVSLVALQAWSAEITLFEGSDFQGRSLTLRGEERALDRVQNFNDRAQSILVRDGTWEVCIDADFGGGCLALRPGEYRRLDGVWSRSISSLRPTGGGGGRPGGGELVLFEGSDFQGRQQVLRGDERNFENIDFNDRAESMLVRGGRWEICLDADFRGGCLALAPGEYRRLDGVWARSVSSARFVGGRGDAPGMMPPPPMPPGGGEIVLYEDADFQGRQKVLRYDDPNLDASGFNDRTESVYVRAGTWEVCLDADFGGGCTQLRPGEYRRLDGRWSRSISSVRLAYGSSGNIGYPQPPQAVPGLPPPAAISSCSAPQVGQCGPCAVTCTDGRRAACSPGSMGAVSWCVSEARCRCQ